MAFVPEDGTGLANANSLCDVEFADTYFAERSVAAWIGSVADKQSALIRATDFIESRWGNKFAGEAQFEDQALSFPRLEIGSDGAVPVGIKRATSEYALRALSKTPLAPDPTTHASGFAVASERRKVGPIETEVSFQQGATVPAVFKPYPAADMLIRPFLQWSGGLIRS